MDEADLTERVIRFVANETRTRPDRITVGSRLAEDLGIDGADGWELIEAYAQELGVDLEGIDYRHYFGAEGFDLSGPIVAVVRLGVAVIRWACRQGWSYDPVNDLVPITIQDLVESARAGRWIHPGA